MSRPTKLVAIRPVLVRGSVRGRRERAGRPASGTSRLRKDARIPRQARRDRSDGCDEGDFANRRRRDPLASYPRTNLSVDGQDEARRPGRPGGRPSGRLLRARGRAGRRARGRPGPGAAARVRRAAHRHPVRAGRPRGLRRAVRRLRPVAGRGAARRTPDRAGAAPAVGGGAGAGGTSRRPTARTRSGWWPTRTPRSRTREAGSGCGPAPVGCTSAFPSCTGSTRPSCGPCSLTSSATTAAGTRRWPVSPTAAPRRSGAPSPTSVRDTSHRGCSCSMRASTSRSRTA